MADLSGQTIASSYEQLLSLPDGGGNGNTLVAVTDGDGGTTFGIKLATNKVEIIPGSNDTNAFEVSQADGTAVFTVNTSTAGASVAGTLTASGQTFIGGTTDEGYSTLLNIEGAGGTDDVVGILFKNTSASNDEEIMSLLASQGSDSVGAINIKRESNADDAYIDFLTQANGGSMTEKMRITSAGEVQVKGASGGNLRIVRDDTTTTSGETLGRLLFSSTDGGIDTVDASAVIEAIATEDFTTGNKGAKLEFSVKPNADDVDHNDHLALTINQDQSTTFAGQAQFAEGSASTPSVSFSTDSDTGMYNGGTGAITFVSQGNRVLELQSSLLAEFSGDLRIPEKIIHKDDTDTFIRFTDNQINFSAGNATPMVLTSSQGQFADGSESAPSHSFLNNTDMGMYRGASNTLRFATGGTERIEVQSSQIKFTVPTFKLSETDGDANAGPIFILQRDNSASEDNGDILGEIQFQGSDSANTTNTEYSTIHSKISNVSNTVEEGTLVFKNMVAGSSTEVMNIKGNTVLVGTSSQEDVGTGNGIVIQKKSGQTAMAFEILDDDTSADSNNVLVGLRFDQDNNADGAAFIEFQDSGGVIGSIKVNGAGNTAFNDSSDERLKENITDVDDGYLELINDIRIRNFDWIDRPNSMKKVGVIAQELEKVIPNVVSKGGDDPNKQPYQVAYPTLVPYLIKAVQELSTKVTELESKLGE